jgi:hypothetical protein
MNDRQLLQLLRQEEHLPAHSLRFVGFTYERPRSNVAPVHAAWLPPLDRMELDHADGRIVHNVSPECVLLHVCPPVRLS